MYLYCGNQSTLWTQTYTVTPYKSCYLCVVCAVLIAWVGTNSDTLQFVLYNIVPNNTAVPLDILWCNFWIFFCISSERGAWFLLGLAVCVDIYYLNRKSFHQLSESLVQKTCKQTEFGFDTSAAENLRCYFFWSVNWWNFFLSTQISCWR